MVSVVTVVKNAAETIADTIDSVCSQSHREREYLVIDGGSTDGTLAILRHRQPDLTEWISEPDRGIYDAMNKGIERARGEVIGLLNADDIYADDAVLASVAETFSDPEVEACYGDLVYVERNRTDRIVRYWRSNAYAPGLFERGWMPAHPTFFVRRSTYQRLGLYNLRLRFQADLELTARFMGLHAIQTRYIPRIQVRMRIGGATNQSIGNIIRGNLESYGALKALGFDITPVFFARKFAMRARQFISIPDR